MNPDLTQAIADELGRVTHWDAETWQKEAALIAKVVEAHVHPEVRTVEELDALPLGSVVRDKHGDTDMKFSDTTWISPETAELRTTYLAKHYGPFVLVYRPVTS